MIDSTLLVSGAAAYGVDLTGQQIDQFKRYADRLIEWNARFNLTAITDPTEITVKHFLDSLSVIRAMRDPHRMIDVGAGAGFPGVPIKIARPAVELTLLETTRKKCEFLQAVIAELGLDNAVVVNARAEEAGRDPAHREAYDVAVARAVAEMPVLSEYLLPFVKIGGLAVAQKSKEAPREVGRAGAAIATLGGRLKKIVPVTVPGLAEQRYLVVLEKIAPTPAKYPRRAGVPSKKPIAR